MKRIPLSLLLLLILQTSCWSSTWGPVGSGLGSTINAMTVYNGNLYAGGTFTTDGNSNPIQHIARWNGSTWTNVGNGLNNDVKAITVFNNELYATGLFTGSGSTVLNHIAKWNGIAWSPVDSGLNNFGNCLYVFSNELYVGGAFTFVSGSTSANRIAKWNGVSWSALGTGISGGIVNTIADYNNEIYIGGTFTGFVSKFNGSSWIVAGTISSASEVYCLASWAPNGASSGPNYYLYAGGDMNSPSQGMIRWNGSSWQSAVQSFNSAGKPKVFFSTMTYLYAGGGFNITVNIPSSHAVVSVAKFNNSFWDSVGTGTDGEVFALAAFQGLLYAGGTFQNADGIGAKNIAKRTTLLGINEPERKLIAQKFYPNPFIDKAILEIQIKPLSERPVLRIFYLDGREMNPLVEMGFYDPFNGTIEFRIDRSGLPSGMYFYDVKDTHLTIGSGKFLVE